MRRKRHGLTIHSFPSPAGSSGSASGHTTRTDRQTPPAAPLPRFPAVALRPTSAATAPFYRPTPPSSATPNRPFYRIPEPPLTPLPNTDIRDLLCDRVFGSLSVKQQLIDAVHALEEDETALEEALLDFIQHCIKQRELNDEPTSRADLQQLEYYKTELDRKQTRIHHLEQLNRLAYESRDYADAVRRANKETNTEDAWLDQCVWDSIQEKCANESLCANCGCHRTNDIRTTERDDNKEITVHEAPVGQVTFVFTDIQNSTFLWNKDWRGMRQSLSIHNDIFRKLIYKHAGYEVKTEGDAFMIVFGAPMDALHFCVQLQMALLRAEWPEEILGVPGDTDDVTEDNDVIIWKGLRVRMGIHTGEPLCEEDPVTGRMDYFGPVVNRAARVSGKGKGGEIVMSIASYDLMRDIIDHDHGVHAIPIGVVVNELGHHALKGFESSAEDALFQVLPLPLRRREVYLRRDDEEEEDDTTAAMLVTSRDDKVPPPLGEVALVFTDVQSSTFLWNNVPQEGMKRALQKHNVCMRSLLHEFHGYEVKTEGDAFMVTFADASNALQWCLHSQLQLLELDWPADLAEYEESATVVKETNTDEGGTQYIWRGLRVRMGIHMGSPLCEHDDVTGRMDYFGPVVNKAARIAGKAHGGEVIVSDEVVRTLQNNYADIVPRDTVEMQELGKKELKGFEEAVVLYRAQLSSLQDRCVVFDLTEEQSDMKFDLALTQHQQSLCLEMEKHTARIERFRKDRDHAHHAFLRRVLSVKLACTDHGERMRRLGKFMAKIECAQMELEDELSEQTFVDPSLIDNDRQLLSVEFGAVVSQMATLRAEKRKSDEKAEQHEKDSALRRRQSMRRRPTVHNLARERDGSQGPNQGPEMGRDKGEQLLMTFQKLKKFMAFMEDFLEGKALVGESADDTFIRHWLVECDSRCYGVNHLVQHQVSLLLANTDPRHRADMFARLMFEIPRPAEEEKYRHDVTALRKGILGLLCRLFNRFRELKRERDAYKRTPYVGPPTFSKRNERRRKDKSAPQSPPVLAPRDIFTIKMDESLIDRGHDQFRSPSPGIPLAKGTLNVGTPAVEERSLSVCSTASVRLEDIGGGRQPRR